VHLPWSLSVSALEGSCPRAGQTSSRRSNPSANVRFTTHLLGKGDRLPLHFNQPRPCGKANYPRPRKRRRTLAVARDTAPSRRRPPRAVGGGPPPRPPPPRTAPRSPPGPPRRCRG